MLSFWRPVMVVTNRGGQFPKKKGFWAKKLHFFARNSAFFYATPMKPPFFWLVRSRINGMTSPPYPEVTLDTFGFLVGARLATRRAVSWPRLPKVALLGSKNAVFGPKPFFCGHPCKVVNRKMLSFWCPVMVVTNKVGQFPKKMDFWPKNFIFDPKFCVFLRYAYETTLFLARTVPTQWDDNSSIS